MLQSTFRLVAVPTLLCVSIQAARSDWPRFRGPQADGTAPADLPLEWSAESGVAWKTELPGAGASSPIVADGKIFLSTYSGYGIDGDNPGDMSQLKRHALCLDAKTGEVIWDRPVDAELPETRYEGRYITTHGYASSTPVCEGDRVYFNFNKSGVIAYTTQGEQLWKTSIGNTAHAWGAGASPVIYKNLLIINASIEGDELLALDKNSGEKVWSLGDVPRSWNTPALVKSAGDGEMQLILNVRGRLRGIDPASGKEIWSVRAINAAELCPSVVCHDNVAYVLGSPRGEAMAVRLGGQGDVTNTHVLWKIAKGSNVGSPDKFVL